MIITDAVWEKRNTGFRVCEVVFTPADLGEKSIDPIPCNGYDYIVAKVPAGNNELIHKLEEDGFRYLENQINIRFCSTGNDTINEAWAARFSDHNCVRVSSKEEVAEITGRIRSEGLFEKDRFSLDPIFTSPLPDRRIANWVEDISSNDNGRIWSIEKKGIAVGFFIISERGSSAYVDMAGIYRKFRGTGLPWLLLLNILKESERMGHSTVTASVSSNNIATLNTFTRFIRFRVDSVTVVLRKFNGAG